MSYWVIKLSHGNLHFKYWIHWHVNFFSDGPNQRNSVNKIRDSILYLFRFSKCFPLLGSPTKLFVKTITYHTVVPVLSIVRPVCTYAFSSCGVYGCYTISCEYILLQLQIRMEKKVFSTSTCFSGMVFRFLNMVPIYSTRVTFTTA